MNLIDRDKLPRHGKRGGIVQWHDIEKAPTVDAIPVSFIQQYIDRFYENEKHYYRSNDMVGYAFKAKRVLLQRLIGAWENEKREQQ